MSVQEIETAIERLPEEDIWKLADWLTEFKNRQWDEQIERDAREGRLDDLINEAKEEIRQGKTRPLRITKQRLNFGSAITTFHRRYEN